MKRRSMNHLLILEATVGLGLSLAIGGCDRKVAAQENLSAATGPAPTQVQPDLDTSNFKVDHPEQFPLATASEHVAAPELNLDGVVSADVSKQVAVPSLANGKIAEIDARLGDEVTKGQLLFKVRSPDVANPFSNYRQAVKNEELAVNNEHLTTIQLDRARLLFDHGAVPKSALEIAENAEVGTQTALEDARIVLETAKEQIGLLGLDPDHPTGTVSVFSPVAGTVTDQEITEQSGVTALTLPAPFTISDLSHVWIICDVWENKMAQVHIGEYADIHLSAYPNRVIKGRISTILPIVDPNLRTAKVRLEVENPDKLMRIGMFVTATFHGLEWERRAVVPSAAIVHLHDSLWVYTPSENGNFRRQEVVAGNMLPGNMQEVVSGIKPGDRVISNALVFENTVEQ
jgi:cobalt-zinc-cadmium efflux system membrane fusion protein